MRKALIVTAAALLAAVIVFLLATLPPSPRATNWAGDPAVPRRTVAGAYHIHTTRSDGSGDKAAVAAAAARAGLQFVILTDHGDGTRAPDPPSYVNGVLCIDAVEISTAGGHYVALGLGAAPYPLGGEPEAVVEDVARLGGFGFAAHPDSPKPELAWTDWTVPIDGIEWLNADSEWRNERRPRLARVLLDYLLRPAPALASILDRPSATLARWDAATSRRPVVAVAGHDAHGGIGRTTDDGRRSGIPGIPSYEASFRSFSTRVILDAPPTGEPRVDAPSVLDAIRAGRVFTVIDGIAGPGFIDFRASPMEEGRPAAKSYPMGTTLRPGSGAMSVDVSMPAGAELVMLHNAAELPTLRGGHYASTVDQLSGAYRVEVRVPGAPGTPPVPWLVSNPIYFLPPAPTPVPLADAATVSLPPDVSWHVEKDRGSSGSIVRSLEEVAFSYRLRAGTHASQFAAVVAEVQGGAGAFDRIRFTAQSGRPMRVSVQLRYRQGGGARWAHSVYLDATPRDFAIPIREMLPADRQTGPPPPLSSAMSLLFVVDLTNARPGDANTIRVSRAGFSR